MSSSERKSLIGTNPPSPQRGGSGEDKGSSMTPRGVYAAVSYMACAVMLVLFNKAALSSYSFPCANVITLFQMICSCCFLYALRSWKFITFSSDILPLTDNSTKFVPLKTSVRGVNVPMYTTLRRTTVVFTMFVEFILVGQKYTRSIIGSVALIVFGAFVAGSRDLSFDSYSYAVIVLLLSCVLAFFLNYSIFLNTTLNSAVTQTICGNLKDLFTIAFGWMVFGGLPFDLLNVIGQLLGFVGSGLYAYCKLAGI
ncbi:protein of unknown function DUF250 [Cynara cardunculus var. scolymus]|uniref:Sugar phosphate transporter domain-containing protein n=1 Tax=Cynara cardunculus var. scolymus TaxID=59895 RepID=A0A118JZC8_CYNCS|nr:protein of unknown function DUF250 [Cynara cardunculus var. scolymus]